jgi:hypothetical protein
MQTANAPDRRRVLTPGQARRPASSRVQLSRLTLAVLVSLSWLIGGSNAPIASAAGDPVVAAAGDIACDPAQSGFNAGNGTSTYCQQKATSNALINTGLSAVLALGDNQYYCGSLLAYDQSYALSWGRVKSITHPVPGNHEYLTSGGGGTTGCNSSNAGAAGYFAYYGAAAGTKGKGYYSYNVGTWHLIALNSQCSSVGGCGSSSAEYKWLAADLAAHPNRCTLAYWHIPLFSSGGRAGSGTRPLWSLLYAARADLILNGHDHIYERFAPQTPAGAADPTNGITQITVGTGGSNHTSIVSIAANSVVRNNNTYGVLRVTLHSTSFSWAYQRVAGGSFADSGTTACH